MQAKFTAMRPEGDRVMDEKLLRDIEILSEMMGKGGWKHLHVAGAGISLTLSDDAEERAAPLLAAAAAAAPAARPETKTLPAAASDIDPAWQAVTAPNLGTFYRSPKPGAAPFVVEGQQVSEGTELCLIEVMKLFTSVRALPGGTVRHIAVADGALVEGGQPLFYLQTN